MRDDDSALPRNFVRTVRSLQHLLLSAVLERRAALSKEFRNRPPLRPFGDAERLGVAFPVMTPETWRNFLDTCAADPTIVDLRLLLDSVVAFGERATRAVTQRANVEAQCDRLRNEWRTRAGASADDPDDHARDARVARAHRAQAELQAERPAAMEELESRFGAGDVPLTTLLPLPLRSEADFFDDELEAEFGTIRRNLVREEVELVNMWEREFRKEFTALEGNLLGPSFLLENNRVDVLPNPWVGDAETILAQEQSYRTVHAGLKHRLQMSAQMIEKNHRRVVLGKLREGLAAAAYEYHIMQSLADEAGDGVDDVLESAVRYELLTLRVIKRRYKNALLTDIARHKWSPLFGSSHQVRHLQTMDDVEAHIKAEVETPLSEEVREAIKADTDMYLTHYNKIAPEFPKTVATCSPAMALHDMMSNRCLEAYFVRLERDANPELRVTRESFNSRLLRLFLSSQWHMNNHRGSVGIDEATARVYDWLTSSAQTNHYGSLNAMNLYVSRPPAQVDENRFDPNRPLQPYGTSYSALPSLDAATKVAAAASMRRMRVSAR